MVIVNYASGIHSQQINLSKLVKYIRAQRGGGEMLVGVIAQ